MRLEHHLVGGYVRYISPHIIIIIIIIIIMVILVGFEPGPPEIKIKESTCHVNFTELPSKISTNKLCVAKIAYHPNCHEMYIASGRCSARLNRYICQAIFSCLVAL